MRKLLAIVAIFLATATTAQASLLKQMQHIERVMGSKRIVKHEPARHWFNQVYYAYLHPPHKSAWQCIHRFEGSWADSGDPYYGGLQMDLGFQRTYGYYLYTTKGTANHWNPIEQMWVAERAYRAGRGFHPWPNTARICGLI